MFLNKLIPIKKIQCVHVPLQQHLLYWSIDSILEGAGKGLLSMQYDTLGLLIRRIALHR